MKKIFMLILVGLSVGVLSACNFHEIERGLYYRSGQLDGKELKEAIETVGLKTVINLRGANPGKDWYEQEKSVTAQLNVMLVDIPMSASRLPHRRDLIALLDAFHSAPRPMLVHCKAGADRTGEASAIYQMLFMDKTKEESLNMLTSEFFHFPAFMPAKSYFIREVWKGEEWARTEYDPCSGKYKYYNPNSRECFDEDHPTVVPEDEDT